MSEFAFKPAASFNQRHGIFVAVTGGTNSGKSYSALRLARGLAGPGAKIAAADTEGGRLLHLRQYFDFDLTMIDPPHRPEKYAAVAKDAEDAGYGALVIDSFSMEWVGLGGVLDWQAEEFQRMGSREAVKLASWIKPKVGHKAMVYSLLQRRIPIVFSMRAEEKAKKVGNDVKSEWAPICNKAFPFEVTVSFMLMQDRQGVIDLGRPHKMEGSHREIFRDGEQLSEQHGEMLARWAAGAPVDKPADLPVERGALPDTFKNAGEFIGWSTRYLADAAPDDAKAWEAKYRDRLGKLAERDASAAMGLTALFGERIGAGGKPAADDVFPDDL